MIVTGGYGHGGDIYKNRVTLDFSANVNPFGTPEAVKEAIRASADAVAVYPDPYCLALREKLAARHGVSPDAIVCGNGAAELIYQFAAALGKKTALLPVPGFSDYESALRAAGIVPAFFPLERAERFRVPSRILDAITEDTGVLMLANPNNPTGQSVEKELLLKILDRCRATGTWLFVDECFMDLADADRAFSLCGALEPNDRVFLLHAFTKTYGMAGVRLGYAITKNAALIGAIEALSQPWNVSTVAQAAGLAALDCPGWAENARALFQAEKPYLVRELTALGVSVLYGDANFLLLSDVPGLCEKLLEKGILIRSCQNYRGLTAGDCRIAVRTHEENRTLVSAIREVLHA